MKKRRILERLLAAFLIVFLLLPDISITALGKNAVEISGEGRIESEVAETTKPGGEPKPEESSTPPGSTVTSESGTKSGGESDSSETARKSGTIVADETSDPGIKPGESTEAPGITTAADGTSSSDTKADTDGTTASDTKADMDGTTASDTRTEPYEDSGTKPGESTEAPGITTAADGTSSSNTKADPGETTAPDTKADPGETTAPDTTADPGETTAPDMETDQDEATTTEEATTEESTTEAETESAKKDFSGLLTLEELEDLSEEEAGATMWEEASASSGARRSRARVVNVREYAFDTYYVNQSDSRDVTITKDGNLKYQMVFRAYRKFEPGDVKIRIERSLMENRTGDPVHPVDIAVPEVKKDEDGEYILTDEGDYISVPNRSTSFNYYIEEEEGTEYLVFFNYEPIEQGTNAAWQVLYKGLKIMELVDERTWELTPQILIREESGANQYVSIDALVGHVDSGVNITNIFVEAYKEPDVSHTPGLYTQSQVEKYIAGGLPDAYKGDNFQKWRFVVWDVKVSGTATQPWSLEVSGAPFYQYSGGMTGSLTKRVDGCVVGYKNNPRDSGDAIKGQTVNEQSKPVILLGGDGKSKTDTSFTSRFYMVTAYPFMDEEGTVRLQENMALSNQVTLAMVGADNKAAEGQEPVYETSGKTASSTWNNINYRWTYSGRSVGTRKTPDTETYSSWLTIYEKAGEDFGNFSFSTQGWFNGYELTHGTDSENPAELGKYKDGTFYQLATSDDVMYIHGNTGGSVSGNTADISIELGKDDYYYTDVNITQKDRGYNVWEDISATPESLADVYGKEQIPAGMNQDMYIFAMFGKEPKKANTFQENVQAQTAYEQVRRGDHDSLIAEDSDWEYVDTVEWDDSGEMKYSFSKEQLAREPYRVMVVHNTINYGTECAINVKVCMRKNSPALKKIIEDKITTAKIEDLSASLGAWYQYGDDGQPIYIDAVEESSTSGQYTGRKDDLLKLTQNLYHNHMPSTRDNAYKTVTSLEKTAQATKTAKTTNDPANDRVYADFCLTAYDGYAIYSQSAVSRLRNSEDGEIVSPGHNAVEFYDLLPYGMSLDLSQEVTAGRITNLDNKDYQTQPRSWSGSQTKVEISRVEDNWRNTGRTMAVFRVTYSGADPTEYTGGKWIEGWGVSFRAYYDINNLDVVQAAHNIFAFMPALEEGNSDALKPLCGVEDSTVFRDDGKGKNGQPLTGEYVDFAGGDINGDGKTDSYTVMYGNTDMNEEITVSGRQGIKKQVRADVNQFGIFGDSAVVGPGGGYTYEITMTAVGTINNVVIFDQLEDKEPFTLAPDSDAEEGVFPDNIVWRGTFQSVDTTGVAAFEPTVYYSASKENPVTKAEPGGQVTKAAYSLTEDDGWYTWEQFIEQYGDENDAREHIQTIAVALNKELKDQSVSFRVRMKAPTLKELQKYGFDPERQQTNHVSNQAAYDAKEENSVGENVSESYNICDPIMVSISTAKDLEVEKEFEGDIPSSVKDTSFEFRLTEEDGSYFAFREYELWRKTEGKWVRQNDRRYATDGTGCLLLCAGEKAIFRNLPDADRIRVTEAQNVFWKTPETPDVNETETKVTNDAGDVTGVVKTRTLTFRNAYRPVVYARKNTAFAPEGVETADSTFLFKAEAWNESSGKYEALKEGQIFYYVKNIRTDGGIPEMVPEKEGSTKPKTGRIGKDGTFAIRKGEIIALFPGTVGTRYRLSEVTDPEAVPEMQNWICQNSAVEGTVSVYGTPAVITNYYKWKELRLTKELLGQKPENCTETFTFRIEKVVNKGSDEETSETELAPITGNTWVLLDEDGKETGTTGTVSGNTVSGGNIAAAGNDAGTVKLKAGQTIKILGLEAGETYIITELNDEQHASQAVRDNYRPVSDKAEVTMPLYSTGSSAKITNEYLLLPLSVTKTVLYNVPEDNSGDESQAGLAQEEQEKIRNSEFTMIAMVKADNDVIYRPLKNHPYTVSGNTVGKTGADGSFKLKNGQTAVFEGVAKQGAETVVWEVQDPEYKQIYPEMKEDAGSIVPPAGYQIKPSDDNEGGVKKEGLIDVGAPNRAEFSDMGASVSFVNAQDDIEGMLFLSKKYTGDQEFVNELNQYIESEAYQPFLTGLSPTGSLFNTQSNAYTMARVQLSLTVTDTNGDTRKWPATEGDGLENLNNMDTPANEDGFLGYLACGCYKDNFPQDENGNFTESEYATVQVIAADGSVTHRHWPKEGSITVYPDEIIIVPAENFVSYTLTEDEESQHRIERIDLINVANPMPPVVLQSLTEDEDINRAGNGVDAQGLNQATENAEDTNIPEAVYLEFSQEDPADGQGVKGTVRENPSATIYNKVTAHKMSYDNMVTKRMLGNTEVPTGAKLVWKVEKYDKEAKEWYPAQEVAYVTSEGGQMTCDSLLRTGTDGKITLIKTDNNSRMLLQEKITYCYPEVHFTQRVYLNLYKEEDIQKALEKVGEGDLLRVVEQQEESDEAWGMLTGYGSTDMAIEFTKFSKNNTIPPAAETQAYQAAYSLGVSQSSKDLEKLSSGFKINRAKDDGFRWGLDTSWEVARSFVNSNTAGSMIVSKITETPSTDVFTFNLRQVISTRMSLENIEKKKQHDSAGSIIVESVLCRGVPYRLYDTKTGERIDEEVYYTGINGEIYLVAGQSAKLDVPVGTMWTVSESVPGSYSLKELTSSSAEMVTTFQDDPNMALISVWPESRYGVVYYDLHETPEGDELKKPERLAVDAGLHDTKVTVRSINDEEIIKKLTSDHCANGQLTRNFLGWSTDPNAEYGDPKYAAGTEITIDKNLALYAIWEPAGSYTLTYQYNGKKVTGNYQWNEEVTLKSIEELDASSEPEDIPDGNRSRMIIRPIGPSYFLYWKGSDGCRYEPGEKITLGKQNLILTPSTYSSNSLLANRVYEIFYLNTDNLDNLNEEAVFANYLGVLSTKVALRNGIPMAWCKKDATGLTKDGKKFVGWKVLGFNAEGELEPLYPEKGYLEDGGDGWTMDGVNQSVIDSSDTLKAMFEEKYITLSEVTQKSRNPIIIVAVPQFEDESVGQ